MTSPPPIDFAIVTPLEEERLAVLGHLQDVRREPPSEHDVRVYYRATLPVRFSDGATAQYEVVVTDLPNMGRVDAANVVGDIIRRWSPQYVIVVGIAGGLRKNRVGIGDVLIADQIVDFESQKLTPAKPRIRWQVHRVDPRLLVAARQLRPQEWQPLVRQKRPQAGEPQGAQPTRHVGPICTGDKVVANGLMDEYRDVWDKLLGVEMEAGGAAGATFQSADSPGFFMIRGVSDLADAQKDLADTGAWREYACDVAAAYLEALLKSGPCLPASLSSDRAPGRQPSRGGAGLSLRALLVFLLVVALSVPIGGVAVAYYRETVLGSQMRRLQKAAQAIDYRINARLKVERRPISPDVGEREYRDEEGSCLGKDFWEDGRLVRRVLFHPGQQDPCDNEIAADTFVYPTDDRRDGRWSWPTKKIRTYPDEQRRIFLQDEFTATGVFKAKEYCGAGFGRGGCANGRMLEDNMGSNLPPRWVVIPALPVYR